MFHGHLFIKYLVSYTCFNNRSYFVNLFSYRIRIHSIFDSGQVSALPGATHIARGQDLLTALGVGDVDASL